MYGFSNAANFLAFHSKSFSSFHSSSCFLLAWSFCAVFLSSLQLIQETLTPYLQFRSCLLGQRVTRSKIKNRISNIISKVDKVLYPNNKDDNAINVAKYSSRLTSSSVRDVHCVENAKLKVEKFLQKFQSKGICRDFGMEIIEFLDSFFNYFQLLVIENQLIYLPGFYTHFFI